MKAKIKVVVTAGPTREHLDPVRFLSNPSTGKMGFAVAAAAAKAGHETVLIAGPVMLDTPKGVRRVDVVSAREMLLAVESEIAKVRKSAASEKDGEVVFISTAAVADWRPRRCAMKKLKKSQMNGVLELVRNPDILKRIRGVRKVGFAAETGEMLSEAVRKCKEKRLEFIVANDVSEKGAGFGTDTNHVALVYPNGMIRQLPMMTKRAIARRIIGELEGNG